MRGAATTSAARHAPARRRRLPERGLGLVLIVGAIVATGCLPAEPEPPEVERPNVVLVTFCTLRADRLGAFGATGGGTPHLDALGRESAAFASHYTAATFSGGSFASILTGAWPFAHGIYDHPRRLDDRHRTVAEMLEAAGYATGAFITHDYAGPKWNYLQGFAHYNGADRDAGVPFEQPQGARRAASALRVEQAAQWLDRVGDRPFLLWFQTQLSHFLPATPERLIPAPLRPAAEAFARRYRQTRRDRLMFDAAGLGLSPTELEGAEALYDAAVAHTDELMGALLTALRERDLLAGTVVVVTADHGEALGEHGVHFNHDANLYEPSVRVPLLLRIPGAAGRRVDAVTRSVDILPTIADLAGLPPPDAADGRSLLPLLRDAPLDLPAFAETRPQSEGRSPELPGYRLTVPGVPGKIRMIRSGDHKLILFPGPDGTDVELYDLTADPGETENLAGARPDVVRELTALLERWFAGYAEADVSPLELDEDDLRSLRSLGYLR